MFLIQQNQRTRGWNRSAQKWGWRGVAQIMYTHVSKCKNDNIKLIRKEIMASLAMTFYFYFFGTGIGCMMVFHISLVS
jgi:hypothetical protein